MAFRHLARATRNKALLASPLVTDGTNRLNENSQGRKESSREAPA